MRDYHAQTDAHERGSRWRGRQLSEPLAPRMTSSPAVPNSSPAMNTPLAGAGTPPRAQASQRPRPRALPGLTRSGASRSGATARFGSSPVEPRRRARADLAPRAAWSCPPPRPDARLAPRAQRRRAGEAAVAFKRRSRREAGALLRGEARGPRRPRRTCPGASHHPRRPCRAVQRAHRAHADRGGSAVRTMRTADGVPARAALRGSS
jgi:hypothetical protein